MAVRDRYIGWANIVRDRFNPLDIIFISISLLLVADCWKDADWTANKNRVYFTLINPVYQDLFWGGMFLIGLSILGILFFWDKAKLNLVLHGVIALSFMVEAWLLFVVAEPLNISEFYPFLLGVGVWLDYYQFMAVAFLKGILGWTIAFYWDFFIP